MWLTNVNNIPYVEGVAEVAAFTEHSPINNGSKMYKTYNCVNRYIL